MSVKKRKTTKKNSTKKYRSKKSKRSVLKEAILPYGTFPSLLSEIKESGKRNYVIHHGDCLDFLKSLPDESVDIIITDPAYSGMNNWLNLGKGRIVGDYKNKENNHKWFQEFKDDPETFLHFLEECRRVLRDNRHIYLMFDSFSLLTLGHLMREVFNVKNLIVWDKVNIGMGHYFRRRHEFIMFATKGYRKLTARDIPDVWRVKRIVRSKYPTQKPVEIFELMLKGSVEPNYVVCDPFVGSGSSVIAALKTGCYFVGADVSKKACEISQKRVEHFIKTGTDTFQKDSAMPQSGSGRNGAGIVRTPLF